MFKDLNVLGDDLDPNSLHIIIFGGCGEFGMNFTGYCYQNKLYIVDCGIMFPASWMLGIDCIIAQADQWIEQLEGVYSYFLTHGHEDHIGGLPFMLKKWPAPVYCSAWTGELLKSKFSKLGMSDYDKYIRVVEPQDRVASSDIEFEWIHVNHSIPMACSLVVSTGRNRIFHTGDIKLNKVWQGEEAVDMEYLAQIGSRGIDLMVSDSTNAGVSGDSPGEIDVVDSIEEVIAAAEGMVVLSTFASNYWRIQTVIEICQRLSRRVFVAGSGFKRTLEIGERLKITSFSSDIFIDEQQLRSLPRNKVLVLASGSQGEYRAALSRIIHGEHNQVSLNPGDLVVFSSRTIPGNELTIANLISLCHKRQVRVVTSKSEPLIHATGHAHRKELGTLIDVLKPSYYLPVHGTFTQLNANKLISDLHSDHKPKPILVENGHILKLGEQGIEVLGSIEIEKEYVESWSSRPITYETLKERLKIGASGLAVITGIYSRSADEWIEKPQIEYRGLAFSTDFDVTSWNRNLDRKLEELFLDEPQKCDPSELNEKVRIIVRRELAAIFVKKPIVISKISFVSLDYDV